MCRILSQTWKGNNERSFKITKIQTLETQDNAKLDIANMRCSDLETCQVYDRECD
jgi:hypothetical protein